MCTFDCGHGLCNSSDNTCVCDDGWSQRLGYDSMNEDANLERSPCDVYGHVLEGLWVALLTVTSINVIQRLFFLLVPRKGKTLGLLTSAIAEPINDSFAFALGMTILIFGDEIGFDLWQTFCSFGWMFSMVTMIALQNKKNISVMVKDFESHRKIVGKVKIVKLVNHWVCPILLFEMVATIIIMSLVGKGGGRMQVFQFGVGAMLMLLLAHTITLIYAFRIMIATLESFARATSELDQDASLIEETVKNWTLFTQAVYSAFPAFLLVGLSLCIHRLFYSLKYILPALLSLFMLAKCVVANFLFRTALKVDHAKQQANYNRHHHHAATVHPDTAIATNFSSDE